jgi:hypothetical protein
LEGTEAVSPQLAAALRALSRFLESDDLAQSNRIDRSAAEEMAALADRVEPA